MLNKHNIIIDIRLLSYRTAQAGYDKSETLLKICFFIITLMITT